MQLYACIAFLLLLVRSTSLYPASPFQFKLIGVGQGQPKFEISDRKPSNQMCINKRYTAPDLCKKRTLQRRSLLTSGFIESGSATKKRRKIVWLLNIAERMGIIGLPVRDKSSQLASAEERIRLLLPDIKGLVSRTAFPHKSSNLRNVFWSPAGLPDGLF
jgi:hypothetical protein